MLLKALVSTGMCYLWLGKFGGARLLFVIGELPQIEENHESSHKQLQRLLNPQKQLTPLNMVSGEEEVISEGDSLTSVRNSYLLVTTGGRTGIST